MLLNPPLAAGNGHVLRVVAVCRISTVHQDERSLEDQEALYREWISKHRDGPVEIEVLASQGSGESLVRDDYIRLIELVESRRFDLVLSEDLGRIARRAHAHLFCETCEDYGTRCIALNDFVDTAQEGWSQNSYFAVMRHEAYNRDTSRRIRRSKRNRFLNRGPWQCPIYGYIKPSGATSIDDIQKNPEAEPVVEKVFAMLEDGASFAEVADWLNAESIPTGPYCRSEAWNGTQLSEFVRNPVLKGLRRWNDRTTVRRNSTGLRRSVKAPPDQLLTLEVPHLAFVDAARFDRLMRVLAERNGHFRRNHVDGRDPREGVPRQRTVWPSQHMQCGICGETFVFGGHGRAGHIFCRGVPAYTCWNCSSLDAVDAGRRIVRRILEEIQCLPDFDTEFSALIQEESTRLDLGRRQRLAQVESRLRAVDTGEQRITSAIRQAGYLPAMARELVALQSERDSLLLEEDNLKQAGDEQLELPPMEEIRAMATNVIDEALLDSSEFGRHMRRILTRLIAVPHRMIDGWLVVMRAFVEIDLAGLIGTPRLTDAVSTQLRRRFVVDLYDLPQREAYRSQVVELRRQGLMYSETGVQLGITGTAAQNAMALQRVMDEAGISDPHVRVESPEGCPRFRRHRHRRFQFHLQTGFEAPSSKTDWLSGHS